MPAADLSAETFRPHVGKRFHFDLGSGGELEFELLEVEKGGPEATRSAADAGLREPFTILFRGPLEPLLPQGTYAVRQDDIGSFPLFVVPIAQDERGTQYQAVFG